MAKATSPYLEKQKRQRPRPVILPNDICIGEAVDKEMAERLLFDWCEKVYGWKYRDGRAWTAVRVASFDELAKLLDCGQLQGVMGLGTCYMEGPEAVEAWTLLR